MVNPLQSRRFLALLLDVFVSTVLFFVGKYATAEVLEDIKFLIVTYQPVFIFLIGAYTVEDFAQAKYGVE